MPPKKRKEAAAAAGKRTAKKSPQASMQREATIEEAPENDEQSVAGKEDTADAQPEQVQDQEKEDNKENEVLAKVPSISGNKRKSRGRGKGKGKNPLPLKEVLTGGSPSDTNKKKRKRKRGKKSADSYKVYIYRVLKQIHPTTGISSKEMGIMNNLIHDIFEHLLKSPVTCQTTVSFKDTNFSIEIPGVMPIPAKDVPTLVQDRSENAFHWFVKHSLHLLEATGILINTFEELEGEQIKALRDGKVDPTDVMRIPQIYPVGPLISSSPVEYEADCLKWLDKQAFSSVLRSFQ